MSRVERPDTGQIAEADSLSGTVLAALPAYNEAATIGSVVLDAQKHADQVLVVDDGSTDRTAQLARDAGAMVIEHEENGGKGATVQHIFEFARDYDVDQLVVLDADWQHDPAEIPGLIERLERDDADLVVGSRYVEGDTGDTPLYRRLGQRVLDLLTRIGSGTSVTDSQSGYRAFSRTAIRDLDIHADGFGIETEMLRAADEKGLDVTEAPISVNYDVPDANTSNSVLHGVEVVDTVLRIVRDRHPLLFFGVPGVTLTLLGLLYGAWTVQLYNAGEGFFIGKALYSAVMFIIGVLSVYSALIMNMIGNRIERLDT